jgi:hypothetical protein
MGRNYGKLACSEAGNPFTEIHVPISDVPAGLLAPQK